MRRLQGLVTLVVVVVAGCNEVLGLDAGRARPDGTGGSSGSSGAGGTAASGTGGSPVRGGSSSVTGGDGGGSGEAGTSEGGTAGARGGRDGAGGSSSGAGGDGGGPGGAGAGSGGTCSSRDCRMNGYDFCINGECVNITSPECDTILGDEWIEDDPEAKPFILGALARGDVARSEFSLSYWNLKLAMRELSEHGRILIEGEERRPVLLACHAAEPDNSPNIDWLEPLRDGLDHLVDLGVSSVLLFLPLRSEAQWLVEFSLQERGHDVFFLDVGGATTGLLNVPDIEDFVPGTQRRYGRLWHMLGDTTSLAVPFVPLVERIEELVNPGASTGTAAEPTRLVVVNTTDEYGREIVGTLIDDYGLAPLRINGMTLDYQPGQALLSPSSLEEVAEFEPHIVLDFSGGGASTFVDEALRARGLPPPFYILPPGPSRRLLDLMQGNPLYRIEGDPSLRTRVVGMNFASAEDPTLKREYLERLHSLVPPTFPESPNVNSFENVYDAVYFLIYGAVAGGRGGTAKAVGFQRLLLGPERHIGPDGIQAVLASLASSPDATLSLSGPSGDFPFHPPSGGRIAFGNVWCVDFYMQFVMDALRYDRASNDFTGTLSCLDP